MVDWRGIRARRRTTQQLAEDTIDARMRLRPAPTSAREARRFARETLRTWGCEHLVDVVELLVSELVTNAVLHARSHVEVRLSATGEAVRVDVVDGSVQRPVLRARDDGAMTGRGLALVAELAAAWGVDPTEEGKSVWFVVAS